MNGGWDPREDYETSFHWIKEGLFKPTYHVHKKVVNGFGHDMSRIYDIRKKDYKKCSAEKMFKIYKRMGGLLK